MKISDLMTHHSATCTMGNNLEEVSLCMWNGDFGILPVTDSELHVIGVITDRDIAMATALQHKTPSQIRVSDVAHQKKVFTCHPEDEVELALEYMETSKVRRLPVVDKQNRITGMVSLADIVAYSGDDKKASCTSERLVSALKSIATAHIPEEKRVSVA